MTHEERTYKRGLALVGAVSAALVMIAPGVISTPAWATTPGQPGQPQAGTVIWSDDFGDGSIVTPVGVHIYDDTYVADPAWSPTTGPATDGNCNGWILNWGTANPGMGGCETAGGRDNNGTNHMAWWHLRQMAYALGRAQGMTVAEANANNAVSAETAGSTQPAAQPVMLQADNDAASTPINDGGYYQLSVYLAATHCFAGPAVDNTLQITQNTQTVTPYTGANPYKSQVINTGQSSWHDPMESLYFVIDGVRQPDPVIYDLNPCDGIGFLDAAHSQTITLPVTIVPVNGSNATASDAIYNATAAGRLDVAVVHFISPAIQLSGFAPGSYVGLAVLNNQNQGGGNDVAFDLPSITEVTPQLDKVFDPVETSTGQSSTLTFTVTNTDDLLAKAGDGVSFTDVLAPGLKVTAGSVPTTDCGEGASVSIGTDGTTGNTTVTLTGGTLDEGQEFCTVTVEVTSDVAGTYTNNPDNMSVLFGVNPPGDTAVTFIQTASPQTGDQKSYDTGGSLVSTTMPFAIAVALAVGGAVILIGRKKQTA